VKKLGEVCDFQGGSQPPKSNFIFEPRKGYVRFLQIRDFGSDKNITYIPESKKNRYCNEEDVLLGRYGASVGKVLINKAGAYNVAIMKTIPNLKLLNKRYFFFYLLSNEFQMPLSKVASRSAQDGFSKDDIFGFQILVPSLPEQKRIVAILDEAFATIDKAKENTEKNLQNAKDLFQSELNSIFAKKGKDWEEKPLGEITTKIGSGATPRGGNASYKSEGISLIRSMNVHDGYFKEKNLAFIDDKQAKELSNVTLEENDVLLNITGASVARCCVVPKEYLPARVNQHVSIIRPKKEIMNPLFLNLLLTSRYYKDQLLKTGEQGATRQAITKAQLQSFVIYYPTLKDQRKIVVNMNTLSAQTQKLESIYQKKLNDLEGLKESILEKAFKGELKTTRALIEA